MNSHVKESFIKVFTDLTRELWAQVAKTIQGGFNIGGAGIIIFHPGGTRFKNLTGFPEPGAFIHVLVEPFFTNWQLKLVNQNG